MPQLLQTVIQIKNQKLSTDQGVRKLTRAWSRWTESSIYNTILNRVTGGEGVLWEYTPSELSLTQIHNTGLTQQGVIRARDHHTGRPAVLEM